MHRIYFLRNTNESDNPDAPAAATIEVRMFDADYRSTDGCCQDVIVQNGISRDTAALYLRRARERGWSITRY